MTATRRDYQSLFRRLGLATALMVPVSALVAFITTLGMMASSKEGPFPAVMGFLQPWVNLIWLHRSSGGQEAWFFAGMALPFLVYAWLWIIGRFYGLSVRSVGAMIASIHLTAWLSFLMLG